MLLCFALSISYPIQPFNPILPRLLTIQRKTVSLIHHLGADTFIIPGVLYITNMKVFHQIIPSSRNHCFVYQGKYREN
ncbi:rCG63659 [Rattus norvegicus]|uniref:RCG63659 n=1 Tax=Rattus norvegicus TaxID=10116 RepID=A6IX49_RAT|nr:rCG63659 [Rattus norvegicus]